MFGLRHLQAKIIILLLAKYVSCIVGKKPCDNADLTKSQCSPTETCISSKESLNGYCDCLPGFQRLNDTFCKEVITANPVTPKSSSLKYETSNGHAVTGIIIVVILILVVICGIYVSRKYKVASWLRVKIYQRNNNYDEVMIGQDLDDDDPPLR